MIKRYKESEIKELAYILKNNGVISVPTDTVFGICARINSKEAYDKLMKVKPRSVVKSFPVMCANEEQIKSIAIVNDVAEKLIKAFMPGPITLVLKKNKNLDKYVKLRNEIKEDLNEKFITENEYWEYLSDYSKKISEYKKEIINLEDRLEKISFEFKNNDNWFEEIKKLKEVKK